MIRPRIALPAFAALLVSACASTAPAPRATQTPPPPPQAAPSPPPAPLGPGLSPAALMGRDAAALEDLLGTPALIRVEGAGEYRRYDLPRCALLVYLYPDERGRRAVAHLDAVAREAGARKPDVAACLAA